MVATIQTMARLNPRAIRRQLFLVFAFGIARIGATSFHGSGGLVIHHHSRVQLTIDSTVGDRL
jgi:hypothetical protein